MIFIDGAKIDFCQLIWQVAEVSNKEKLIEKLSCRC